MLLGFYLKLKSVVRNMVPFLQASTNAYSADIYKKSEKGISNDMMLNDILKWNIKQIKQLYKVDLSRWLPFLKLNILNMKSAFQSAILLLFYEKHWKHYQSHVWVAEKEIPLHGYTIQRRHF